MRIERCRLILSLFIGLFLTAGCDSNSMNDRIVLTHTFSEDIDGNPIRFVFSSDDTQSGEFRSFSCNCFLDIGPFLETRSFSKAELLESGVTSARLKSFFPIGQRLDFLSGVELILQASGSIIVAEDDTFPPSQEIALSVVQGKSISALLIRPRFTVQLRIDSSEITPDIQHELGIDFTVELEMEGL